MATDAQVYNFGPISLEQELQRPASPLSRGSRGVREILRMLPRLVGLNHDLMNGSASLPVNGIMEASLRANGKPSLAVQAGVMGKPFVANGHSNPKVSVITHQRRRCRARL